MSFDSLEEYICSHIDDEPEYLYHIRREAHLNILYGNMLSGHLQGRILKMLTKMINPTKVLEIGTFVGYSTLCFAEALTDDGEVHTVEINDELEDVIISNFSRSPYGNRIKLHIGDAKELLGKFEDEFFELAFIDSDKKTYWETYEKVLPLIKKDGFIIVDNTLWYGKVAEPIKSNDRATNAILQFNQKITEDYRIEKVILPIRDGLTLIRKL